MHDAFEAIGRVTEQVDKRHPHSEVRIATGGLMNPLRNDWTCTIRRGEGDWPGYDAEELFPSTLVAVCVPSVAKHLRWPQDLRKAPAIVTAHLRDQWTWWSVTAGARQSARRGNEVTFESSSMAVQAALDGVGVAVTQLAC